MSTKEIICLVRQGIVVGNSTNACNIDLNRRNTEVVEDFIAFCNNATQDTVVPVEMGTAWDAIPEEWCSIEGGCIPEVQNEDGHEECKSFGKPGQKKCAKCSEADPDSFARCHTHKAEKDAEKDAQPKGKKAKAVTSKEAHGAEPSSATPPEPVKLPPRSRYDHPIASLAALMDEALFVGGEKTAIVEKLTKDWEKPDPKIAEKLSSHVSYLPRKRGVIVTITKTDTGVHYKADAIFGEREDSVGVYTKLRNIHVDNRSPEVQAAHKAKQGARLQTNLKAAKDATTENEPAV